ncbi:AGAP008958-PA-like protein [Anopheles sinensis]|uniref:AGAP008958-PA-like protein n=1 Tax=Anopheles sinensis TaxID=74873 RepID=A0A084WQH1_ANOSI|nr:AGAP008958-PA-like protein [Anopheles sinensis]
MDDSFVVQTDFFRSSLGNQQFNHYPMKLPTKGMCQFFQNVHDNYHEYIQDIINFPLKGECPIAAREFHLINHIFPSTALPPTFPIGLWKIMLTTEENNIAKIKFAIMIKIYRDGVF